MIPSGTVPSAGTWLRDEALDQIPGLVHGAIGRPLVDDLAPDELARRLGFRSLLTPRQVHGTVVLDADAETGTARVGDGWLVLRPGRLAAVLGADCPGVLLVLPEERQLALAHCGWRGTAAGFAPRTLDALLDASSSRPDRVIAWIGPGIGANHYEVDEPVLEAIACAVPPEGFAAAIEPTRPGHARLDLTVVLTAQLHAAGLRPENVRRAAVCTYDDAAWHSHRRDGASAGRHVLLGGWLDP